MKPNVIIQNLMLDKYIMKGSNPMPHYGQHDAFSNAKNHFLRCKPLVDRGAKCHNGPADMLLALDKRLAVFASIFVNHLKACQSLM